MVLDPMAESREAGPPRNPGEPGRKPRRAALLSPPAIVADGEEGSVTPKATI